MGTPDFAVESLEILVEGGYNVVGVITVPDKPAGRGHKIQYSAVKKYAVEHQLPVLQPEKLKDENFLNDLRGLEADLQVVVAFRMLPEVVWNMPRLGTINLHASLLPQYRGAAPINWAIINGEKETGVTTFLLTHEIDTGKIIFQEKMPVSEDDDAGTVHDRLMDIGDGLVRKTVDALAENKVRFIDQSELTGHGGVLRLAPKIFRETCEMDFTLTATEVCNFVRGLSPYPAAWTTVTLPGMEDAVVLKVFGVEKEVVEHQYPVGKMVTDGKRYLKIAVRDGFIHLKSVQAPAKKRMDIGDLLRGFQLKSY